MAPAAVLRRLDPRPLKGKRQLLYCWSENVGMDDTVV